ncbi:hypothetical protein CCYA_CCYA16G4237 [Cyanidiococcus yangmingshanensis]|uniref:RING-type E3 ubiquitin transferase n=1 Tax=Cyanidiococcus yangmingshanensis TaxID=2690220 RepID=A0A7J7IF68_9RHOD|nr:hypothetical protein F1559_003781 [Cyanidiococcus yangmingshanensis]KAK4533355.1 hypothetical protein CCYA_CCYA16G4237 [Cyanidiococcus yangmingshanensis]
MGNTTSHSDLSVASTVREAPANEPGEPLSLGTRPAPAVETSASGLYTNPTDGAFVQSSSWPSNNDSGAGIGSSVSWLQGGSGRAAQPVPTMVHAYTIRNELNVRKKSVRLIRDPDNPQQFLLEFVFDSTCSGLCTVYFMAKDATSRTTRVEQFHFQPLDETRPVPTPFEAGMGQLYRQNTHRGFVPQKYRQSVLFEQNLTELSKHRYPIVILLQRLPNADDEWAEQKPPPRQTEASATDSGRVRFQATYVTLTMPLKGLELAEEIPVKVAQQKILVDGTIYELQEIYGIEERTGSPDEPGSGPPAVGETDELCIICMTDPRDTTVLPCRHLCLCVDCAQLLRVRSDRCPICRSPVDSLLHIRNLRSNAR